jgi:uncharacterized protein YjbI with pentapeptide repeats
VERDKAVTYTVMLRYAENANDVGQLAAGELALYDECDRSGHVWIVNQKNVLPTDFRSITGALSSGKAPKLAVAGCDTTAFVYGAANRTGQFDVVADRPFCNPNGIRSVDVKRTRTVFIEMKSCAQCNLRNIDLRGLNLGDVRVIDSDMTGARLSGTTVFLGSFTNVNLTGADISNATWRGTKIASYQAGPTVAATGASFRDTVLEQATLRGYDFSDADFTGAKLGSATITQASFARANLANADFTGAKITAANFSSTNLDQAKIDGSLFLLPDNEKLTANPCTDPMPTLTLSKLAFATVKLSQFPVSTWRVLDLTNAKIDVGTGSLAQATLCGLKLGGASFLKLQLGSTQFDRSDLTRTVFTGSEMQAATFRQTALSGTNFTHTDLTDTDFTNAVADADTSRGANFYGAVFRPKTIIGARFSYATFTGAAVLIPPGAAHAGAVFSLATFLPAAGKGGVSLAGSDLSGLDMRKAIFGSADFSKTVLQGTQLQGANLENAVFCGTQVNGAQLGDAKLTGAFFPQTTTTVPSIDDPTTSTACPAVELGPAATLDEAVTTTGATCPDSSNGPCAGTAWTPAADPARKVCPSGGSGSFAPTRKKLCAACTKNCDCAVLYCTAGKCGDCKQ